MPSSLDYQAHVYKMAYPNLDPFTMASNNEQLDIPLESVSRKDRPKGQSFCRNLPLSAEPDLILQKPTSFCR